MSEIKKYNHKEVEAKFQGIWKKSSIYQARDFDKKKKFYILIEFPYPSGAGLHVGHIRSWSAMDAYARKKRMQGYNVLYPIGWDAFGLPAENYAIKTGIHPSEATKKNISHFKDQCQLLGLSFDWSREIDTTDPKYYKWTQWIFIQLFKKGLAYRKEVPVNWCPFCKTNLADEEVLADGTHERCGNPTEKRLQKQWLLRITKYAERLLEDLKSVDYSEKIATQQINWIGKSEGARIKFQITNPACEGRSKLQIEVFTTALDTIFGVTFLVVAPEIAKKLLNFVPESHKEKVLNYIKNSLSKTAVERGDKNKEKTGVEMGFNAVNPLNDKEIPVFVADYILMDYGTGAVMGVPGHDARDHEFAKKYNLPIKIVIKPTDDIKNKAQVEKDGFWDYLTEIKSKYSNKSILFDSGELNGFNSDKAKKKLEEILKNKGWGEKTSNYHLHDWIFSRQHYWGEPIPMVYCEKCAKEGKNWFSSYKTIKIQNSKLKIENSNDWKSAGWYPVAEDDLPVELPYMEKYQPSGTGESPLVNAPESWLEVKCPKCGSKAQRETDTMPNWAGSNWYYLGFLVSNSLGNQNLKLKAQSLNKDKNKTIFEENQKEIKYWMPVDIYQGGFEHTTLHLLYSRFIYKFLFDLGIVPSPEPYTKRRSHGIVLGSDGRKMSKSFGNVVNPDDIVEKYGADSLRLYEMFMGPFDQMVSWSEESLEGCFRFINRVWNLCNSKIGGEKTSNSLLIKLHQTIKKVDSDIENLKFNTAISALMEFINLWTDEGLLENKDAKLFVKILAPFAPHLADEVWNEIFEEKVSIHTSDWPVYDPKLIIEDKVTIVVQVNGKVRSTIEVKTQSSNVKTEIIKLAGEDEKVKKWIGEKKIKKEIFIAGKLLNIVI